MDLVPILPKDSVPSNLAVPFTDEKPSYLRRNVIIGTSIGVALILAIFILMVLVIVRRKRHQAERDKVRIEYDDTNHQGSSMPIHSLAKSSTQEIGNNSMIWPFRDVHGNGLAELLGRHSPSDVDDVDLRQSNNAPAATHESNCHRSSQAVVQRESACNVRIYLSTEISRRSWTNDTSSPGTSAIETVIFASGQSRDHEPEVASIASSNLEAEIYSSYMRKPLDPNRALPPIPISGGSQESPAVAAFNRGSSFRERPQVIETEIRESSSAFVSSAMPISAYFSNERLVLDSMFANWESTSSPWAHRSRQSGSPTSSARRRMTSWD